MARLELILDARKAKKGKDDFERLLLEIQRSADRTVRAIGRIGPTSTRTSRQATTAMNTLARAFKAPIASINVLFRKLFNLRSILLTLGSGLIVRELLSLIDTYQLLENRVLAFFERQEEANAVLEELFRIARRSRSPLDAVVSGYQRLIIAQEETGLSARELLSVTETLNKAIILSGASSQEARAGLTQLTQGITSGQLRGEELRSVLENIPFVARLLANELDVTIGRFRELAFEGKVTTDVIISALVNSADEVEERFGRLIPTVGQAFQVLQDTLIRSVGIISRESGLGSALSEGILGFSDFINDLTTSLTNLETVVTRSIIFQSQAFEGPSLITTTGKVGDFLKTSLRVNLRVLGDELLDILTSAFILSIANFLDVFISIGPKVLLFAFDLVEKIAAAFFDELARQFQRQFPRLAATFGSAISSTNARGSIGDLVNSLAGIPSDLRAQSLDEIGQSFGEITAAGQRFRETVRSVAEGVADTTSAISNQRPVREDLIRQITIEASILDDVLEKIRQEREEIGLTANEIETLRLVRAAEAQALEKNIQLSDEAIRALREQVRIVQTLREDQAFSEIIDDFNQSLREQREEIGLTADELEVLQTVRRLEAAALEQNRSLSDSYRDSVRAQIEELQRLRNELALKDEIEEVTLRLSDQRDELFKTANEVEKLRAARELERFAQERGLEVSDDTLDSLRSQIDELQRLRELEELARNIGQAFGDAFLDIATGARNAGDAIQELAQQILRLVLQQTLVDPFVNSFVGLAGSLFGGPAVPAPAPSAQGNVFNSGRIVPFASGGVINSPVMFPLGGNRTGLAGEAGPEAIIPLARDGNGDLGIRGGGTTVYMNVQTPDVDGFKRSSRQIANGLQRNIGRRGG